MSGVWPNLFSFYLLFFILKGAPAPSFYLGTRMGGKNYPASICSFSFLGFGWVAAPQPNPVG